MNATTIHGVLTLDLGVIPTEGGPVLHMLRSDSPLFTRFGELYFSEVEPGAVKAWKRHTRQTQHFAVPAGRMQVVIHDSRPGSPTHGATEVFLLGRPDNYRLLRIPPLVWYGFGAVGQVTALLCNCADLPHDPAECQRAPRDTPDIPYRW